MLYLNKDLFIFLWLVFVAWSGIIHHTANIVICLAMFYFLFRYIIWLLTIGQVSNTIIKYLISRYNIFLLVHGFIFLLLLISIDFDFFSQPGDWFRYDINGRLFVDYLRSKSDFVSIFDTASNISGRGYIVLVGLIYYLFDYSTDLAVAINIFFMVSSFIVLYLIVQPLFGHRVAKNAMYISVFFPLFMVWEINLWKECFISFSFLGLCLMAYRVTHKWKFFDFIMMLIFAVFVYNIRFWWLLPVLGYFIGFYLFLNFNIKKIAYVSLALGLVVFVLIKGMSENATPTTIADMIFEEGYSIQNTGGTIINYQANLLQSGRIIGVLMNHPLYFVRNIPKTLLDPWSQPRVYHIPFLSPTLIINENRWLFPVLTYLSGAFLWLNLFVAFSGAKEMIKYRRETALILCSFLVIPFILSLTPISYRYMDILKFFVIVCIALGLEKKYSVKANWIYSFTIAFGLILVVNRDSVVIRTLIISLGAVCICYFIRHLTDYLKKRNSKRKVGVALVGSSHLFMKEPQHQ